MQAGLVTEGQMRKAMVIVFSLALLCGFLLMFRAGPIILWVTMISIACGVFYTAGPYPLGYLGLGDIFAFLFFGPVAVLGTYYVQTLEFDFWVAVAGVAPGLFSAAVLTVNNLRDADGDAKSGKKTLAVRFGKTFARQEYLVSMIGASAIALLLSLVWEIPLLGAVAFISAIAAMPSIYTVWTQEGKPLNQILARTGKLLLVYSILFCLAILCS